MLSLCNRRREQQPPETAPPLVEERPQVAVMVQAAPVLADKAEAIKNLPAIPMAVNSTAPPQANCTAPSQANCTTPHGAQDAWSAAVEKSWLKNRAAQWGLSLTCGDQGGILVCGHCQEPCVSVVSNPLCNHSSCAMCWTTHAERFINEHSKAEQLQQIPCLGADCSHCVPWAVVRGVCAGYSNLIAMHVASVDAEFRKNMNRAVWASVPKGVHVRSFEVCTICRDVSPLLLINAPCNHAVCEGCWKKWTELQIPRSFASRRDTVRCFSPRCQDTICTALWNRMVSISEMSSDFDSLPEVARRRQLKSNTLYPEAMQVDCPMPECWGLGYLGFDTVMCFVCEHQWIPQEPGTSPNDVDVQEIMGVKMKQCPRCQEHIEKNGGCDHMTCRCKYEFHWTTLQPFR